MSALADALIRRNILPGRLGRHVLFEFLRALGLALCVFTGFFLLMTSMKFESQAEAYGTNVSTMVETLPYFLPYLLLFTVPISFLVAGVLAFGKLEGNGEIGAMRAAGVRLTTVLAPALAVALLATVPMLALANSGIEWGFGQAREIIIASGRASLTHKAATGKTLAVGAGNRSYRIHRFRAGPDGDSAIAIVEFEDGAPRELVLARDHELEIAVDRRSDDHAMDIFRFRLAGGDAAPDGKGWARVFRPGEVLLAAEGRLEFAFESVTRGRRSVGSREYEQGIAGNVRVASELASSLSALEGKQAEAAAELATELAAGGTPSAATVDRLDAATQRCGAARADLAEAVEDLRIYEMEIHRKMSMAFSPLAMALFGIALGLRLGKGSRVAGFTIGIAAIAVVYYPLWISGQGLAASGVLPPGVAVWAAPALVGAAGAAWLSRMV